MRELLERFWFEGAFVQLICANDNRFELRVETADRENELPISLSAIKDAERGAAADNLLGDLIRAMKVDVLEWRLRQRNY